MPGTMFSLTVAVLSLLASARGQGTLKLDIKRRDHQTLLRQRATSTTDVPLSNNITGGIYVATVTVGTPPQTLTLHVDTGSSDTWLPASNATICRDQCFYGSYNPDLSSTFSIKYPGEFKTRYGDGTTANGSYFADKISISGTTLDSLVMGLASETDNPYGLVGVGFPSNEAIAATSPEKIQPNLPVQLQQNGQISSTAYSLWLNDPHSATGSILFGGVDTTKYAGSLTRVKMLPSSADAKNVTEFVVALSSVVAASSSGRDSLGSTSFPISVLLDSGGTSSSLPSDLVDEIWHEAGVVLDPSGRPLLPCKFAGNKAWYEFQFGGAGGAVVNVTVGQLMLGGGRAVTSFVGGAYGGMDACEFGLAKSGDGRFILGDSFLRSAYVVYDMENLEVGLAPAAFNATGAEAVVPFESRAAPIPGSTPAPSQDAAALSAAAVTASPTAYAAAKGFQSGARSGPRAAFGAVSVFAGSLAVILGVALY